MAITKLDPRDRAILRLLQADGRLTNAEIAERVNLSPSACLRRLKALEGSGLIAGYAAILDARTAGFPGIAFIEVTLERQARPALDAFEAAVRPLAQVLECYLLAGQADFMLKVAYRDAADLERLHSEVLTQLPGVVRVQSILTLRTVKKTTALPI